MADTYQAPRHGWTCFHCGETFQGEAAAREHFGGRPKSTAGCLLKLEADRDMTWLRRIRRLEAATRDLETRSRRRGANSTGTIIFMFLFAAAAFFAMPGQAAAVVALMFKVAGGLVVLHVFVAAVAALLAWLKRQGSDRHGR
jgi:hypothetical protein